MLNKEFEKVKGTWDHREYLVWKLFNVIIELIDDSSGKVPHEKWRQMAIWDLQKRHDEEINEK